MQQIQPCLSDSSDVDYTLRRAEAQYARGDLRHIRAQLMKTAFGDIPLAAMRNSSPPQIAVM